MLKFGNLSNEKESTMEPDAAQWRKKCNFLIKNYECNFCCVEFPIE